MFGDELKRWRLARRLSQEALSDLAQVSTRHLSCLERNIAWPSESMVLKLSRALELPLRERNSMLGVAGYAQRWHDNGEEIPTGLMPVVDRILATQAVPAYALNGKFTVLRANPLGWTMLKMLTPDAEPGMNVAEVFLSDGAHRTLILDYPAAGRGFLARLRAEAAGQGPNSPLRPIIQAAERDPIFAASEDGPASADPVLPLTIDMMGTETRWLTVLLSFGTPQDAMVEQLTIEQMLPADDATEAFLKAIAQPN
ncbi:helix-turn-helix domain-containing protein [Parvularcula lutaonensis]|uniref:Helix-turn-helix domain-containing protein n=1 Tax=Parvularcula lutaonensis TaxID=491923 RepID=A0ABV7MD29_9PROT|nr:helix-turn-helix domain-containing protein [Parvularcula lutaonensis]GGY50302.1 transcriptional regulator [Parvularcula lutaonensis]